MKRISKSPTKPFIFLAKTELPDLQLQEKYDYLIGISVTSLLAHVIVSSTTKHDEECSLTDSNKDGSLLDQIIL